MKKIILLVMLCSGIIQAQTCGEAILNALGFNDEFGEDGESGFSYVLADGTVSFSRFGSSTPDIEADIFSGLTAEAMWHFESSSIIRATDGNHYILETGFPPARLISLPPGVTTIVDVDSENSEALLLSSDGRLILDDYTLPSPTLVSDPDNFGFERIWGNGDTARGIFYAQRADGSVFSILPGTSDIRPQPNLDNLEHLGQVAFETLEVGIFQDGTGGQWIRSTGTLTVNPITPPSGELFIDVQATSPSEYEFLTDAGNLIQYDTGSSGSTTILTGIDAISAGAAVNLAIDYDTNMAYYRAGSNYTSSSVSGVTYAPVNIPAGYTLLAARAYYTGAAFALESPSGDIELWHGNSFVFSSSGGNLPNLSFVDNAPLNLMLRANPSDPVIMVNPCACNVSAIVSNNISLCNDNGTPADDSDDFFTADITVTFGNVPSSGSLDLTGDGTSSVAVGSLDSATSHTFTGVTMPADGTAIAITATFSDDMSCTFSESDTGTAPVSCNVSCDSGADGPRFLSLTARSWAIIGGISVLGIAVFLKREQLF